MITASDAVKNMISSPVRRIQAKVELYLGSTLVRTCGCEDILQEFKIERVSEESAFFGFGIGQKINVKLIDRNRELDITTSHSFKIAYTVGDETIYPHPEFFVTRTNRDENTNGLSITAYDNIYKASKFQALDLNILTSKNFTLIDFATECRILLGCDNLIYSANNAWSDTYTVANYLGTETLREVLDDIAEATQTVYYVNNNNALVFTALPAGDEVTIDKSMYFTLDDSTNRRLSKITHVNADADAISAQTTLTGTNQILRDNGFWSLLEDDVIGQRLEAAIGRVGNMTIGQFECEWRGNFLAEVGDKLLLTAKDDSVCSSYLLNDVLTYNGTLSEKTSWRYSTEESELESSSASLGEVLRNASIKVDKVNKEIDFIVKQTEDVVVRVEDVETDMNQVTTDMNTINVTIDGVVSTANKTVETVDSMGVILEELSQRVATTVSADEFNIAIDSVMSSVTSGEVTTSTGYTFNQDGLTISKTDTDVTTQISENGMTISQGNATKLEVNHQGVNAENLHATTYLIIGLNSRFEDYDNNTRTGCFWIGEGN